MSMTRFLASLVLVGAAASTARADKVQQATQLWNTRCANCHVVGRGQEVKKESVPHNFTDLTMTTRAHDDAWLAQWIASPNAIKPDSKCFTAGLEPRHIDLLISFLRWHARPVTKHTVPAAQYKPPLPREDKTQKPRNGLSRGR
jgi:cytochrome c2